MIAVEGLTKIYGNRTALDHVSFEVPEREIFGFVGPNGAGKTTTLRILAALLEPTEGKAYIGGADVMKEREKVHTRIGYMPDFFGVYDQLTVAEYLDFYAACYRQPKPRRQKIVDDLLALVGMAERKNVTWRGLSAASHPIAVEPTESIAANHATPALTAKRRRQPAIQTSRTTGGGNGNTSAKYALRSPVR